MEDGSTPPAPDSGSASLPLGCRAVEEDDPANFAFVSTLEGDPVPFAPTRAYAAWNPVPCDDPPRTMQHKRPPEEPDEDDDDD